MKGGAPRTMGDEVCRWPLGGVEEKGVGRGGAPSVVSRGNEGLADNDGLRLRLQHFE